MKKRNGQLITEEREYLVLNVKQAKQIVREWLVEVQLSNAIKLGLPEIDDRYHYWRVPLRAKNSAKIGEVVIDAYSTEIVASKTTKPEILTARILKQDETKIISTRKNKREYKISNLRNTVGIGDSSRLLEDMPSESVDLIFTSPPYYNARPEYSEYEEYDEYLFKMRQIIRRCPVNDN